MGIEGRWYLQYTGSPFWQDDDISLISFNFSVLHKGEDLVLEDKVEYRKNGKMRFRLGYDYPVESFERTFKWKGREINRFFRNRFEITILEQDYMVLFFEKTIISPASIDIVTRSKKIDEDLKNEIFEKIRNNVTISAYLEEVEEVNKV